MNWTPEEIFKIKVVHHGTIVEHDDLSIEGIADRISLIYKDKEMRLEDVPYPVMSTVHGILDRENCKYVDDEYYIGHGYVNNGLLLKIDAVPQFIYCKSVQTVQNTIDLNDFCELTISLLEDNEVEAMWYTLLSFIRTNYCCETMNYVIDGKDTQLNLEKLLQMVSEQTPAETLEYFKSMREAITK